jgi:hypothetical protein
MSTVKSEPLNEGKARGRFSYNRLAAFVAWLIGVFFTYLFLSRIAPAIGMFIALLLALGLQGLLTMIERPLWRWAARRKGGRLLFTALAATALDAGINAGGMFPYIPRLAQTDLGLMLIEVFKLSPNVSAPAAALIAFLIGLLAAGAPEALWEYD